MRKLIIFLVTGMLWCNLGFAATWSKGPYLEKKIGSENAFYNSWIEDYNKFKKNFNSEVNTYCNNQMISSAGVEQLLSLSKCKYKASADLAKKYNVYVDEVYDILYSWHGDDFAMARHAVIAIKRCSSKSCRSPLIASYQKNRINLMEKLFKNLDSAVKTRASSDNAEWLAKQKKTTPKKDNNKIVAASSGTGFFVSSLGQLITNNHVIDGCNSVKLNYAGSEYTANTIASDKTNDLALLKTNIKPKSIFPINGEDATLLEEIFVAGFPLGKKVSAAIKVTSGRVSALAGYNDNYSNFQIDAALNHGNSGGPIVNKKGNVVGVAVATIDKSKAESFNFGIKSSVLTSFAKSNNVKLLSPNRRQMDMKDLGSLVTDSTVMLECWMSIANIKKIISAGDSRKAFYSEYQ